MKWIKCSERLPKMSTRCYVTTQRGDGSTYRKLATLFDIGWVITDDYPDAEVIEWLDESPNAGEQEELWDEFWFWHRTRNEKYLKQKYHITKK